MLVEHDVRTDRQARCEAGLRLRGAGAHLALGEGARASSCWPSPATSSAAPLPSIGGRGERATS